MPNSNKRYSQADLANFRQRSDHAILRKKIQVVHLRLHEPQHVKWIRTLTFALKDWTTMFVKFARRKLLLYKRNMEVWLSLKASFIWTNCKTSRGMFFGENNAKEPRLVKSSQTLNTNYQAQWGIWVWTAATGLRHFAELKCTPKFSGVKSGQQWKLGRNYIHATGQGFQEQQGI